MMVVFIFNCLLPAPGAWAQFVMDQQAIQKEIEKGVKKNLTNNLDANIEKAVEAIFSAKDIHAQKDAIVRLHQLMDKKYAQQQQRQQRDKMLQPDFTQKAVSTYVAPRAAAPVKQERNEVLQHLAQNDIMVDMLVDYIDPFYPGDVNLQSIAYASEILGNTVDSFLTNLDDFTKAQMDAFLPFAQLRTLYRLNKLTPQMLNSLQTIMAVGSMRIAMWKMHNYYVQTGQQDPLLQPQEDANSFASTYVTSSGPERNGLKRAAQQMAAQHAFLLPDNVYQQINSRFLSELSALKAKKPQEGEAAYQLLLALSDYAVTYALLVNPQQLVKIVKLFDEGPDRHLVSGEIKGGKFLQPYSAVLNTIFTSTFENTKYMTNPDVWPQVIEMLKDFSDPAKYSLPTRIFALEAASLLYSSNSCQASKGNAPQYDVLVRCNTSGPEMEKYRTLFAQRTVDLYVPLTATHYLAMKDYGLDSEQMKALADKLAYIYNGFANDELKWDAARAKTSQTETLSPTGSDGKPLVLNGKGSIPRLLPINQGHMFQLPSGKVVVSSGFGRDSKGNWVEMQLQNKLNARKVNNEYGWQFTAFVGNAIFWIYGGEIFTWLGMAFRTTKGAIAALPKAAKAARAARPGRASLAAAVELEKSIRYTNLAKNLSRNGVVMTAQRVVPAKTAADAVKAAPEFTAKMVTGNRVLQGNYSRWNPKRWVGLKPAPIDGFYFQQATPGFKWTQGYMDVSNSALKNGIHSWDDWRKVRAGFQAVKNPAEHAYPQFFDYATRKAVFQELLLQNAMNQAARNGAFNVWVPIKTPSFQSMQGKVLAQGSTKAPVQAGESFMTEQEVTTWWNATRLGKPGNPLAWEKSAEVYITPSTTQNLINPEELRNAVKLPLEKVTSNEWQPELINHYFKTVDRQGLSRYLLPKYVPNGNFWTEATRNLRFGAPMTKALMTNSRFWRGWPVRGMAGGGFLGNVIFFSAWAGMDMGVYPFQRNWIEKQSTAEHLDKQNQFGDTFDPEKTLQDEKKMKALAGGGKADFSAPAIMSTFDAVQTTQRETSEGSLIVFPILLARHYLPEGLGHLSLLSDQDALFYEQNAQRVQFNRATLQQYETAQEQAQQQAQQQVNWQDTPESSREYLRTAWETTIAQDRAYYLSLFPGENAQPYRIELEAFFQRYLEDVMAVFATNQDPQIQNQRANELRNEYATKLYNMMEEIYRMNELMREVNSHQVQEEKYDFDIEDPDSFPDAGSDANTRYDMFEIPADSTAAPAY